MKLHITSIVPIELYTIGRRKLAEDGLVAGQSVFPSEREVVSVFREISGEPDSIYEISPGLVESAFVAFHESSLCVCVTQEVESFEFDHAAVTAELMRRNNDHKAIANDTGGNPLRGFVGKLKNLLPGGEYGEVAPVNYIFSFYVVEKSANEEIDKDNLTMLIEPSSIDMDDMMSTKLDHAGGGVSVKKDMAASIKDVDISGASSAYVSWATIVSVNNSQEHAARSRDLLTALEVKLQIIWNRCHSVSKYIEDVFDGNLKPTNIDELFWSFSKTLDDAKSVLSSTLSSRMDALFREMIATSKIEDEVSRLEQKLLLLEKYISQRESKRGKKYQKVVELLLFVTAIASLAQVFFPVPVSILSERYELAILAVLTVLGVFAIFKSK